MCFSKNEFARLNMSTNVHQYLLQIQRSHLETFRHRGGGYFVSLPLEFSEEIRQNMKWQEEGWGRMKTKAKIRETLII